MEDGHFRGLQMFVVKAFNGVVADQQKNRFRVSNSFFKLLMKRVSSA
jgi:hypothetical protein